jgi:hypothetical protein
MTIEDAIERLIEQNEGEIKRLREDLTSEKCRSTRLESECKKLWAAYSLARSAASRAEGVMKTLQDENGTPGGDDIDPLNELLQHADATLGIVELTEAM